MGVDSLKHSDKYIVRDKISASASCVPCFLCLVVSTLLERAGCIFSVSSESDPCVFFAGTTPGSGEVTPTPASLQQSILSLSLSLSLSLGRSGCRE